MGWIFAREALQQEKGGLYVDVGDGRMSLEALVEGCEEIGARADCGGYYEVILEIDVDFALARGHPDVGVVARHDNGELRQVLNTCPSDSRPLPFPLACREFCRRRSPRSPR